MSVECSQVDDAFAEYFLVPSGTDNQWLPSEISSLSWDFGPYPVAFNTSIPIINSDGNGFTVQTNVTDPFTVPSELWLNITVPGLPPYWQNYWGLDNYPNFVFSQLSYTAEHNRAYFFMALEHDFLTFLSILELPALGLSGPIPGRRRRDGNQS